jgi:predicted ATPase/class 3 adenylate cyclase
MRPAWPAPTMTVSAERAPTVECYEASWIGSAIIAPMTTPSADDADRIPTGTVTFFFSDIEGSTKLVEALGERYADVLQRHRAALREAFAEHGGVERGTEGDSFFVAFADAGAAVAAAVAATRNLAAVDWPDEHPVRVRIGLHTGEGRLVDGDYVGLDVHRAARIAAAGYGGQVLISESTRILAERSLEPDVSLRDLGEHRLKDLPVPEHVYQVLIEGIRADFPPLRSIARTVANLPAQLATIVGRDDDVEAVRRLLGEARLVTVTGPGGTGKTRLVQEVARAVAGADSTDVVFVPLEALTDADLIPVEVIRAFRLDTIASREPLDRLAEHLAIRKTLLVLDNLEQLSGAGAIVRALLERAPTVSILASSQAALHVGGEQEYALGTLPLPGGSSGTGGHAEVAAENPAVRLFVERARAVRADFVLDDSNVDAVVAICARLDGLPLAIELAAAQVKLFSPGSILERVSGQLDSLTSRRDDLPARHRTLRATLAWSYALLDDSARRLFRRLSVFAGGAQLAEIEAIAAVDPAVPDPIGVLETLVDRSLVSARHGASGSDRFGLLETMRAYGHELLDEAGDGPPVVARHAATYRELARQGEKELYGPARRRWLDRLSEDQDNLRAALDELQAAGDLEVALDLAADLWRFWQLRGLLTEGRERLDDLFVAAARPGGPTISPFVLSRAEEAAGGIRYWTSNDRRIAQPFYERSLEHAEASGDRLRAAWAKYNLAFVFDYTPSLDFGEMNVAHATALRNEALAEFRALDERRGIAESLWAMGGNALSILGDPVTARRLLEEALPLLEELGDLYGIGWALTSLSMLEAVKGDLDRGEALTLRAAAMFERDGEQGGEIVSLQALGAMAARRGDDIAAVRIAAATEAAAKAIGVEPPRIPPIADPLEAAASRLSPEMLERERGIGVALGARSILATALESWRAKTGAAPGP